MLDRAGPLLRKPRFTTAMLAAAPIRVYALV